ncbi:hypothetical protein [Rubeoparvulum massiliense]|uniref:hypothetical protein n=1 Tax=Rubeoparvulum massiliense TaxID=1631346 RepID=UPI00065DC188|nr:hypothetical protein [Rubeoparvulum massiliense]
MNRHEMSSLLVKRATQFSEAQWEQVLEQLELHQLFLVIKCKNNCLTKGPNGGFVPLPSKDDSIQLLTSERMLELGLPLQHSIMNAQDQPHNKEHLPFKSK